MKRSVESLGKGDWLALERLRIDYPDSGKSHAWESVRRLRTVGAVLMIARLKPSERFILIRQYRPAVDGLVVEFPAGLIDDGETADETAVRELVEETGYHGEIIALSPMSLSSPGMSAEGVRICFMDVDETREENRNPIQNCEENERIEVILKLLCDMPAFLAAELKRQVFLDSRLVSFFMGLGAVPDGWGQNRFES